ncbi:MAG: N-acetylglucosaminyldiphosphoundecaprenol N-acetyl-beta-D-mannosaminyltransferase [Candidatus Azotimanducaceae bacterium]|jgi:N-acetylglucosaminyldiphosphoundecaprenol N-acetyl-beta-D-mannosaminyltransferase
MNTDIHSVTEQEVVDLVEQSIDKGEPIRIGVVNAAKLVNMQADSLLAEDVRSSDLVLADGMSVVWASKILGHGLPERVAGCDLMYRFFELANQRKWRVYCLGATEEISAKVEENLLKEYPNLTLAGRRNGYFSAEDEAEIAAQIAASKPHFLLVAMTSPKKENFMGAWGDTMNVPIVHGVGGSFDVYAGLVERAPEAWQKLGLEWLYRIKQEPGRLWKRYLITNTKFTWMILKEGVRKIFG